MEPAELVGLGRGFNSFGDGLEVQGLREVDDAADDIGDLRTRMDAADEAAVDLEDVDWHRLQVSQRRVSGTEIIDGHAHAQLPQSVQNLSHVPGVLDERCLGDLDDEGTGRKTRLREGAHGVVVEFPQR